MEDLGRFLYRNPPEFCLLCVPEPSGTSSAIAGTLPAICAAALRNLIGHLHQNPPEPHQPSAPEPAGTSSAICAGTICTGTRRHFVCYVYRNTPEPHQPSPEPYPEPHQPSAPEPAGTLFAICTGTIRNHPDPHQPSAPEPSGTSSAFCAGTLWNLISFLRRNPLEPSGTLRNLFRNLGLQLHRIAPELFWAKDPIARFAVGEYPKIASFPEPTLSGTLRNLPTPSGTNLSEPSGTYLQASGTYTILHRNSPEPCGTCLRNLHQHTPELSGTFWNLPPEPTPAHAGTLRNLPEPSSGTCSCDPRRHTPELIWAEDPINSGLSRIYKNNSNVDRPSFFPSASAHSQIALGFFR